MQMRARKKFQQTLNTLLVKHLFHRHFDNMPLPRKLTNINILISISQSNSRQRASCPQSRPTRSQLPFFAKTKDRTHAMNPTQAVSKNEMRAARRVDNLANQSPNPYFAGDWIGWPCRRSWTSWPTNRTANGVANSKRGRAFKLQNWPQQRPQSQQQPQGQF